MTVEKLNGKNWFSLIRDLIEETLNLINMPQCIIPNCQNNAEHNIGIRCRRPDTSAIWAPNCDAFLCDEHAEQGCTIEINIAANTLGTITTNVSGGGNIVSRTTPIIHDAIE
jgi:hypothetical protein